MPTRAASSRIIPARISRGLSRNGRRGGTMRSFFRVQQIFELGHELTDVAEMPIHRRESHVRDLVELLQLLHDERADFVRADLFFRALLQRALDTICDRFERRHAHGPLFARLQQSRHELLTLEAVAVAVFLHDTVRDLVDQLVAGEALATPETFAAPPNHLALAAFARVDDFVSEVRTVGALHRASPSAGTAACARLRIPP